MSSVRLCVKFRYRDHIGWNTSKIISRSNSLSCYSLAVLFHVLAHVRLSHNSLLYTGRNTGIVLCGLYRHYFCVKYSDDVVVYSNIVHCAFRDYIYNWQPYDAYRDISDSVRS